MIIKRLFLIALVSVATLAASASAHAGFAVGSLVGGVVNHLEDQDFETIINNVQSPTDPTIRLDIGDYLVGMYTISTLHAPPGTQITGLQGGSTFTGVFLIEVATKGASATIVGGTDFTFKPAPATAWLTLSLTQIDPGTMVTMFEDNGGFPNVLSTVDTQTAAGLSGALNTAEDGTELWEFGYTGAAGEFWTAAASSDDVTAVNQFNFKNALNVTEYVTGGLLEKHNFKGPAFGFTTATHLQTTGELENVFPTTSTGAPAVLPVFTEADLYIAPVAPEASSILIWSVLGLIGGGVSLRRARSRVAA